MRRRPWNISAGGIEKKIALIGTHVKGASSSGFTVYAFKARAFWIDRTLDFSLALDLNVAKGLIWDRS